MVGYQRPAFMSGRRVQLEREGIEEARVLEAHVALDVPARHQQPVRPRARSGPRRRCCSPAAAACVMAPVAGSQSPGGSSPRRTRRRTSPCRWAAGARGWRRWARPSRSTTAPPWRAGHWPEAAAGHLPRAAPRAPDEARGIVSSCRPHGSPASPAAERVRGGLARQAALRADAAITGRQNRAGGSSTGSPPPVHGLESARVSASRTTYSARAVIAPISLAPVSTASGHLKALLQQPTAPAS